MDSEPAQPTKILRANGNLTLIVGEQKQRIVISRDVVIGICKPSEAMLTRFIEATQAEVKLSDDDATAVTIACTIAHSKFHDLPLTLTIDELSELATLCDKYDITVIVGPFIHAWVRPWFYGPEEGVKKYLLNGNEKSFWIAWVFGFNQMFYALTDELRRRIFVNEKGQCVCNGGLVVLDDIQMPPGIVDNLSEIRENCIRDLLRICYSYINEVIDGKMVCKAALISKKEECFAITFGSCVWGFHSLGLSKPEKTSADIHESIDELWKKLKGLKIYSLPEQDRFGFDPHDKCNFGSEMREKLAKVIENLPSAYQESHMARITELEEGGSGT